MFPAPTLRLAERVLEVAGGQGHRIVTAESVTGGLVAGALTAVPGASGAFEGAIVAYTPEAKQNLLAVPADLLEAHGPVSPEATRGVLEGALEITAATAGVAVTGYASPGPGVPEEGAGSVFVAAGLEGQAPLEEGLVHPGTRSDVREAAVHAALDALLRAMQAG